MLIHSDRHRPEDLEAWGQQSNYDARLVSSITGKAARAIKTLQDFATGGGCYIGCSWGKDSTVLAHIAAASEIILPVVWVRVAKWENPDCEKVRDIFLAQWGGHIHYDEILVESSAPRRWEADHQAEKRTSSGGFNIAAQRYGNRHITGVRAQESATRALTVRRNGEASTNTCRPLAHWTGQDIFTYMHAHDLPIHPAYAMNMAGALHRDRIRVGSLGGERGTGVGRAEWERRYYGDIIHR